MDVGNVIISGLVQTKNVERAIAPFAAQVTQLILLKDSQEKGEKLRFSSLIVPAAQKVLETIQRLISEAINTTDSDYGDEEYIQSMPSACDLLALAAGSFLVAAQRLEMEPQSKEAWHHIVRTAKDVLEGTMKVLLVSDDCEVRKLVYTAHILEKRIGLVLSVTSMKALVLAFKGLTESMLMLSSLIELRQQHLINTYQRDRLILTMSMLRKTSPMLSTAMQTYIKYPTNPQAKASKEYVTNQVLTLIDDVIKAVENKLYYTADNSQSGGHFVVRLEKLLTILEPRSRYSIDRYDFDTHLEAVVRHSMSVTHFTENKYREKIIDTCKSILRWRGSLMDYLNIAESRPGHLQRSDFEEICEKLLDDLHDIEISVNAAILYQITIVFSETDEPLDRLVKAAVCPTNDAQPIEDDTCQKLLQPFVDEFHTHSERLCQVSIFAAASSSDARRVNTIKNWIQHLEQLDPEIVPVSVACRKDYLDKVAIERLRLLKSQWRANVESLVEELDDMMDVNLFLQISEESIASNVRDCDVIVLTHDKQDLCKLCKSITGQARRVTQFATRIIDNSASPIYRNGLLVYTNQLKKAITAVRSGCNHLLEKITDERLHENLNKRNEILLKCVQNIRRGVDEENQPNISCTLRNTARTVTPDSGTFIVNTADTEATMENVSTSLKSLDLDSILSTTKVTDDRRSDDRSISRIAGSTVNEASGKAKESLSSHRGTEKDENLSRAVKDLVNNALGLHRLKTDMIGNDIISEATHVIEIANTVSAACSDETTRLILQSLSSDITQLTPQLLDKAKRVSQCEVQEIDPLYQVAEAWCDKVERLESNLNHLLMKYHSVSNKIVVAHKVHNELLLGQEQRTLEEYSSYITNLVTSVNDAMNGMDFLSSVQLQLLMANTCDLENLTATITTLSSYTANNENEDEIKQLTRMSREWAAKVFCICDTINTVADNAKLEVLADCLNLESGKSQVNEHLLEEIRLFEIETVRYTDMFQSACKGLPETDMKIHDGLEILSSMEKENNAMSQIYTILTGSPSNFPAAERLFAPQNIAFMQCNWVAKSLNLTKLIENLVVDFCRVVDRIAAANLAISSTSDDVKDSLCEEFKAMSKQLTKNMFSMKGLALKAIETSTDLESKGYVRQCLDDISQHTEDLMNALNNLASDPYSKYQVNLQKRKLEWACKINILGRTLAAMKDIDKRTIRDIMSLLSCLTTDIHSNSIDGVMFGDMSATSSIKTSPGQIRVDKIEKMFKRKSDMMPQMINSFVPEQTQLRTPEIVNSSFTPLPYTPWRDPKLMNSDPVSTATLMLQRETEKWEDEKNEFVRLAKEMCRQMIDMAAYSKGKGSLSSKEELIKTAKSIAGNGKKIVRFAHIVAKYCIDDRFSDELMSYAKQVPTVSTQLSIIASVKASTHDDRTADKILVKNAEILMHAIMNTLKAAESASVKGLHRPEKSDIDETEAIILATEWKWNLREHHQKEALNEEYDELGLRVINTTEQGPQLNDVFLQR
ncbi:uncharacterized protein LOC141915516 [Tubulanus polymorphus]|uniref:uncharacterized protein LOC141915516 n=1 Tax=Tubulanus polymorphus TaxID=672921 RepID=UPI003DA6B136